LSDPDDKQADELAPAGELPAGADAAPPLSLDVPEEKDRESQELTAEYDGPAEGQHSLYYYEPKSKPYDPKKAHDDARRAIALWLLGILTFIVVGAFLLYLRQPNPADADYCLEDPVKSFLELVLSPVVALVSAATGFYFGTKERG